MRDLALHHLPVGEQLHVLLLPLPERPERRLVLRVVDDQDHGQNRHDRETPAEGLVLAVDNDDEDPEAHLEREPDDPVVVQLVHDDAVEPELVPEEEVVAALLAHVSDAHRVPRVDAAAHLIGVSEAVGEQNRLEERVVELLERLAPHEIAPPEQDHLEYVQASPGKVDVLNIARLRECDQEAADRTDAENPQKLVLHDLVLFLLVQPGILLLLLRAHLGLFSSAAGAHRSLAPAHRDSDR